MGRILMRQNQLILTDRCVGHGLEIGPRVYAGKLRRPDQAVEQAATVLPPAMVLEFGERGRGLAEL